MDIDVIIVNAFTQGSIGGNPAAIVTNAEFLTSTQKQKIAFNTGLSETAFISPSDKAAFRLEFFTPARQIAHCGHATIASFSWLKQEGLLGNVDRSSKETIDGTREIRILDGKIFMEQRAPSYIPVDAGLRKTILDSLSFNDEDPDLQPLIVNTGNSFMILEVKSEAELKSIQPAFKAVAQISQTMGLIGYYIFLAAPAAGTDATARMFAPYYGIEEESATGMAAGPLAAWLYKSREQKSSYRIEQGRFMKQPSPSLIDVKLEISEGEIKSLFAGGEATYQETVRVSI